MDAEQLDGEWKCGNEFAPYHPSASHIEPAYRDGWNQCYYLATLNRPIPHLSAARIDRIAELVVKGMPDGLRGFQKLWGWQQFARSLLEVCATPEPQTAEGRLREALRRLLQDSQHSNHECGDPDCPVSFARSVLHEQDKPA